MSVGNKRNYCECVIVLEFENSRDNIGEATIKNAHDKNHGTQGVKTRVVNVFDI